MIEKGFVIFLVVVFSFPLFSQENIGISPSNYSPTSSVLLNPSSIADSKVFWEIHLAGIYTFIDNNYLFIPKSGFSPISAITNPGSISEPLDKFSSSDKKGFADISVHGPSAIVTVGKHAFGFNTQVRAVVDARNISSDFAKFAFENFEFESLATQEFNASNMKINGMAWGEFGLNYATILKQEQTNMYLGGISLRKLFGIAHLGTNIDELSYSVPDSNDINFLALNGKYGFTSPAFNSGGGWAIDLGFTYKKTLEEVDSYVPYSIKSNCRKCEYKYKIGISLLDLGWITYHTGSRYGEIENKQGLWEDINSTNFDDADEVDATIVSTFVSIDNQQPKYRTYLPTALSFQYDYNYENGFYLNATLVQNLSFFNKLGVNRQNLFALTPRYELPRFEVSLPISLRSYTSPSIGLALRLWNNLIIGTDRIGPLLLNVDVYGLDFYFALKVARIYTKKCKAKRVVRKFDTYRTSDCHFKARH